MILLERNGAVATLTLNRPDKRNALDQATWGALSAALETLAADDQLGCLILTGAGGHFSAGADIAEFAAARGDAGAGRAYEALVDAAHASLQRIAAPVIAAIDGVCFGSGLGLALASDFRIASAGATFAIPATRIGLIYGARETAALLATVSAATAKRLILTADRFDSATALRCGLITDLAPADAYQTAHAIAERIVAGAPLAIQGAKRVLREMGTPSPDADAIRAARDACLESADYREAVAAFLGKRPPQFTGR